ncbi:MAG: hypothetical protein II916_06815 [Oscillospiraceae bacterium]|nr:hypothetical protein [Oscillospiraceae bacterium]
MKHLHKLPILLCLLLLTGCGAGNVPVSDGEDDIIVITDPPAETTAPDTTEADTEPETTETEEPATESLRKFDDPAEQIYYNLREVLAPEFGISDTDYFDPEDGEPALRTQGIISAHVQDLFGDDTPELILIRSAKQELLCELYILNDDGACELVDQNVFSVSEDDRISKPSVSIAGEHLIVRDAYYGTSGTDDSGTTIRVLDITSGGFTESAYAGMVQSEREFQLEYTDGDSGDRETIDYSPTSFDYDEISYTVREVLENAGLDVATVQASYPGGIIFEINAEVSGEELLFMVDTVPDSGTFFLDHTELREVLSGRKPAEAKTVTPTESTEETDEDETVSDDEEDEDETDEDETETTKGRTT